MGKALGSASGRHPTLSLALQDEATVVHGQPRRPMPLPSRFIQRALPIPDVIWIADLGPPCVYFTLEPIDSMSLARTLAAQFLRHRLDFLAAYVRVTHPIAAATDASSSVDSFPALIPASDRDSSTSSSLDTLPALIPVSDSCSSTTVGDAMSLLASFESDDDDW